MTIQQRLDNLKAQSGQLPDSWPIYVNRLIAAIEAVLNIEPEIGLGGYREAAEAYGHNRAQTQALKAIESALLEPDK